MSEIEALKKKLAEAEDRAKQAEKTAAELCGFNEESKVCTILYCIPSFDENKNANTSIDPLFSHKRMRGRRSRRPHPTFHNAIFLVSI